MEDIIFISIITFIGTLVGTISGFGISTVMLPLLVLLFFPFRESLLLAGILHVFDDLWKILLFKRHINWKIILEFGFPAVIASIIGARLIIYIPQDTANTALGIFFMGYVIFLFAHPHFNIKHKAWTATTGGALSGFFAGLVGLGGAIRAAFLSAFNLHKEVYLSTIGVVALFTDLSRLTTYVSKGIELEGVLLTGLPIFIAVSYLGAKAGQKIINKIPQKKFRMVVAVFLFLAGISLIFF